MSKDLFKKVEEMLYNYKYLNAKLKNINLDINSHVDVGIDEETLYNLKCNIESQLKKINSALETLTNRERQLIELRYFKSMSWKKIIMLDDNYAMILRTKIINKLIPYIFL
ncbi:hypothetical protein [Clostridium cochlearium]|uniref:hypothetical protein n=1 Tax=Clostridium cochlearium TaxID=1494 RepID=UPI00241E449A|nr:hypothetical protein [Clostridium cochlearium]MBE6064694.1 hypothetical protein [Clostridium cochlearium]